MAEAFILINAESGFDKNILEQLKAIPSVVEAYIIYGAYDLLCKVKESDLTMLKDIITERIRKLEYVKNTLTLIIV